MPDSQTSFDIRDYIAGSQLDNPWIQAGYDTINRMGLLIGDIPFHELCTQPWEQLVPRILPRLSLAEAKGLIRNAAEVEALLGQMQQEGSLSFYSVLAAKRGTISDNVGSALARLSLQQGIAFPAQGLQSVGDLSAKVAMENLIEFVGEHTYQSLFQTPRGSLSPGAILAVQDALENELLPIPPNDRCCKTIDQTTHCNTISAGKFCNCTAGGAGDCGEAGCSIASATCP